MFSRASKPPCGIENGLWLNSSFPSLSSNIGKSTIQQNSNLLLSIKSNLLPNSSLTCPASFSTIPGTSATKKIQSPGFELVLFCISILASSVINLAIGPWKEPSSKILSQANPFAFNSLIAKSVISSKKLLGLSPTSCVAITRTTIFLNALNSRFAKISETSTISNGFLKSGLSVPYLSITSSYFNLGNGYILIFLSENCLKALYITGSILVKTSSWLAKLISISN